ncbi:MAG: M28 family peptidase, partial [Cyclobacteriaceae bacterium]|nr:M28 family peptidase [Cyclobacteriaceae bacterium]
MKIATLLSFVLLSYALFAQNEKDAINFANTITANDLEEHLTIIASDALEGRETGTRGQKMAAAYIKSHFIELGLTGPVKSEYGDGYFQKVPLYTVKPGNIYIKTAGEQYDNYSKVFYYGSSNTAGEVTAKVVFIGEGTEAEMEGIEIKNKIVMLKMENARAAFRGGLADLFEKGAEMVFIQSTETDEDFTNLAQQFKGYAGNGRLSLDKPGTSATGGVFFVSPSVTEKILGTDQEKINSAMADAQSGKKNAYRKLHGGEVTFNIGQNIKTVNSENVLGFLEGTDKKDEIVIVTSHYDHIGKRGNEINNGADDDGSGTVSVLEIAEAFIQAKKKGKGPRRSILFMTVSGEEKGLLGSAYYASNPVFPLENTVVDLNIDMVGRTDPEHEDKADYVYLVGSDKLSSELHELSEKANATFTQLELDYTYNDENHPDRIYYRSDH